MKQRIAIVVCLAGLLAAPLAAQNSAVQPLRVKSGSIVTFHLQTRLHTSAGDALDAVPAGTALRVRLHGKVDSSVDRDGSEFKGTLASPLVVNGTVVAPAHTKVQGVLALMRSQKHPEGFRYELLVTNFTERGKSVALTASLDASLADGGSAAGAAGTKPGATKQSSQSKQSAPR